MADKKQTKVYLIPEDETRDSHTYLSLIHI